MNFITTSTGILPRISLRVQRSSQIISTVKRDSRRRYQTTNWSSVRWMCNANRRRKNVGVPKNVQVEPPPRQLRPDETPWEDYLIPELAGNSKPSDPGRYSNEGKKTFLVLGVESSCDDTAAAVVRSDGVILGEACVSQHELTESWGGVVPHVARDAHESAIESVIHEALEVAGIEESQLDAVAATMGPGLEVCLRVGYRAARAVARRIKCDFVAVNHLEAHLLVARMPECINTRDSNVIPSTNSSTNMTIDTDKQISTSDVHSIPFPFLTLLVSGGHCQLLLVSGVASYEVLGGTLDDALGEAYDKTARMLGLKVGGGGGPALEALAMDGDPYSIPFPVPMSKRADCNFSFAGLKTCVRLAIDKLGGEATVKADLSIAANIAASFQEAAVRHLEQRLRRAIKLCEERMPHLNTLVVSGGVAANCTVRSRIAGLCANHGWTFIAPPLRLCTDNGVMVAWAGIERLQVGIADNTQHLDVRARWPLAGFSELASPLPEDVSIKTSKVV